MRAIANTAMPPATNPTYATVLNSLRVLVPPDPPLPGSSGPAAGSVTEGSAGTPVAGSDVCAASVAGTAVAGSSVAGTAVAGTSVAGTAVAGIAVAGTAVAGTGVTGAFISIVTEDFQASLSAQSPLPISAIIIDCRCPRRQWLSCRVCWNWFRISRCRPSNYRHPRRSREWVHRSRKRSC